MADAPFPFPIHGGWPTVPSFPAEPPPPEAPPTDLPPAANAPPALPSSPRRPGRLVGIGGLVLVAIAAGSTSGYVVSRAASTSSSTAAGPAASATATAQAASLTVGGGIDVAAVIAAVEPSVVSITTELTVRQGQYSQRAEGAGTGIVLDVAGDVLTNAHVVDGATSIEITVPGDATPRVADLVAADTSQDIAVVKLRDRTGLVAAPLGDSDALAVGDPVVAIGNALALEGGMTVTEGIVSATGRSIDTDEGSLSGLVQTDAAISSGNSGGPLVDAAGEVVGIDTAVAASSSSVNAANIGFAISIDTARAVAERLLAQ